MTTFSTYATATYATGNIVVVQSAENMLPGLPITFLGNTFGNVTANATYYIGNISFGYPTSNITITSLPGGAVYPVGDGSGSMVASFSQGGQQIIPTIPPGEPLNQAFDAINLNFDQIFAAGPVGSNIKIDENTIYTLNTNGNLVLNPNGIGNVVANAHVVPDRDRVRNLGAPLLRWNTIYAQNIIGNISGNTSAGGTNGQIQFNNNGILDGANGFIYIANTDSISVTGTATAGNLLTPGIVSSAGGIYGDIYTTMIDSGDSSAILIMSDINTLADLSVGQSLDVGGTISATGNITGNYFFGNGSQLTGITADNVNADDLIGNTLSGNVLYSSLITVGDLTNLSVIGNTTTGNLNTSGEISATGNITGGNILFGSGIVSGTGNIYANKIFANIQGNIDAAGNLYEIQFNTTGDQLGANANFTYDSANNVLTVNQGNIIGGNLLTDGNISALGNVHGNWFIGNVDATVISASGNITGNYFFGNGSQLTGIDATSIQNGNSNVRVAANANVTVGVSGVSNVAVFTPTGLDISGDISATGNITANYYFGNGSQLTGVAAASVNANALVGNTLSANVLYSSLITVGTLTDLTVAGTANVGNLVTPGVITATGNIDSAANVSGANFLSGGVVSATGTGTFGNVLTGGVVSATSTIQGGNVLTPGDVSAGGSLTGGNIFTGGVVSATSTITGGNLATAGTVTATGTITGGNLVTGGFVSATGEIVGGNISTAGNITGSNVIATTGFFGNINLTGDVTANSLTSNTFISATGNVTGGNLLTNGTVSATGNIEGNYFIGNGAFLTGIDTTLISNGNTNVQTYANGNVAVTVAGVANTVVFTVSGTEITGNANVTGTINGGNLLTAGDVSATGNVTGANVNTATIWSSGNLSLNPVGNIILDAGKYINNVNDPVQAQDAATKQYVDNMVSTGIAYHQAVYAATTTDLATTTGGTITYTQPNGASNGVGAYISTTGSFNLIDTANVQTANTRILVKDEGNAVLNGVYYWANVTTIIRTTDTDEYGPNSAEQLSVNDYFFVQNGNVNKGSAWVVDAPTGNITFGTSNIQFAQFSSSQTYTANTAAGLTLTGTVFATKIDNDTTAFDGGGNIIVKPGANLTTPNIGAATGSSLSVTGNVTGGNITTAGYVTATGNVTGGNIVTAGSVTATGNITGNYFIGNGSQLTGVTAASVDAANLTGNTLSSNVLFSSLTTVGTLTSLSVSGNVDGGNIHTAGVVSATGTVTGGNIHTAGSVSATGAVTAGNVFTGGEVSATGTGTFGNVLTGGIVSATSSILGGNVLTPGDVSAGGSLTGGNIFTGGQISAVSTITGGNIATAGFVTATGNVTGGNLVTGGFVSATGNVSAGNVLFGSGIVSGTGNIYAGNIFANVTGNIDAAGANTEIQFNENGILGASPGFTFNTVGNILTVNGNINGANLLTSGRVSAAGNIISGANISGNFVSPGANREMLFNDNGLINSNSGLIFDKNGPTLSLTNAAGTVITGFISSLGGSDLAITPATSNLVIWANTNPRFSNTYTLGTSTFQWKNVWAGNANIGTLGVGNLSTSGNIVSGANILAAGYVSAAGNVTGGNINTAGEVSGGTLNITGNAVIGGDLAVNGNVTYINVTSFNVEDPIIGLGRGANDTPLTSNDGKDRGEQLWYFNTGANVEKSAFIGYDNSVNKIIAAIDVTIANEIVTVNEYGTFEIGNLESSTASVIGNITGGNILFGPGIVSGTGNIYANNIFANISGNIDAAGNINEVQFNGTGDILTASAGFTFDPSANVLTANGNINGANLFASGDVSASGNITGNNVVVGNILIPSTGNVTLGNVNINDLAEPVANSDAATKFYVDSVAANVLPIISNQTISPDGISNTFVLNQTATDVGILLTINGVTQTPTTNYTVTGNSLTMAETPLSSDIIQVRFLTGTQVGGGGGTNYANANVVAYGQSGWAGNIIPSGNAVYSLGNATNQWKDLYVSGNTIYIGNVPMTIANSVLSVDGNAVLTSNTTTNISTTGNVTAANVFTGGIISAVGNVSGANFRGTNITVTGTGTAVNASSGNILTNQVTGTQFNFLSGLYTVNLNASGATANYTLNLPANAGANGQVLTTNGTGGLSWTAPAGSYGNTNVATFLGSYGSNTISTTGNISAGNVTLTGNLTVNGSPIYGAPASFAKYNRTTTQTGIVANTVIVCNVLENAFGSDITVNTSTGNVTLAPNLTYRLRGTVGSMVNNGNPVSGAWQWRNVTGNAYIGTSGSTIAPAASNYNTGASQIAEAVFTPSVTTVLQLTVTTISNGSVVSTPAATNEGGAAWMDIEVIGGQAPITAFSTAGNVTGGNIVTAGQVTATGNITGNYFIGNGSQLTGLPASYGNANLANIGSNAISTTGNISSGNLIVSGTANTGVNALLAGPTFTPLANTVAGFVANVNNYSQVTFQNKSTGADATADYILTADNGSDTVNYGDFGIINSGYDANTPTNSLGNIVSAGDSYLYAQGNISNTSQSGGNLAIGTTVAGKSIKLFAGGNTNSALVANISNTGISVAGNVTASNFIGNISITGNVTGTSANVSLVAGSYTATFDNTGVLTLPTIGGSEGGEINFGIPTANTTLVSTVKLDVYQDRIRFFDGSTKGAYIDLSQAATGVGTLLNNRVSGIVNAGTFVTMDNIKATVTGSAPRGLSLATVSGSFSYNIGGTFGGAGVGSGGSSASGTLTTTPTGSIFNWGFTVSGDIATYTLTDTTNSRCYRITVQIGASFNNNSIIIERLI